MAGYVWSGNNTGDYVYDSAGGAVTESNTDTGDYQISFGGLSSISKEATIDISPYYDFTSPATCSPVNWGTSDGALLVDVSCYDFSGSLVDSEFDVTVTLPKTTTSGVFDTAFANKGGKSGTLTSHEYNSAGKSNSVKYLGTGKYQVTMGGAKTTGTEGLAVATAAGAEGGDCQATSWKASSAGEVIDVDCFDFTGAPANRNFFLTYELDNNLMDESGITTAAGYANKSSGLYQPANQYDNVEGARLSVVRFSSGSYEVLPVGSEGDPDNGGLMQVVAVSKSYVDCMSDGWDSAEFTPSLSVICLNPKTANYVNAHYVVEWDVG